ncbi:hypothetical protein G8E10_23175, partial [Rhizobiaceae bacterium CRRU44]
SKKDKPPVVAKTDENALPPLVRPRMLSGDVTRLLKSLGTRFETTPSLASTPGKVASAAPDPALDAASN